MMNSIAERSRSRTPEWTRKREQFQDLGCEAVDMSLLASVLLTPDTLLWTVDKNLDALATRLGVAFRGAFG